MHAYTHTYMHTHTYIHTYTLMMVSEAHDCCGLSGVGAIGRSTYILRGMSLFKDKVYFTGLDNP